MDNPIRGRMRELTRKVEATVPMNIHNRFDVEVIDSRTGKIRQRAQAENVICSQLWTRLFAPNTYFNYIHYGTGSGTPAATDASLFTFLGYGTPATADDVYTTDFINRWVSLRRKIQLSESTAVGSTLTEVGIGYGTSSSNLVTHAMLKDMNGNQISIVKTSTDIISIYATVFLHLPALSAELASGIFTPMLYGATSGEYDYDKFEKYLLGTDPSGVAFVSAVFANGATVDSPTNYKAVTVTYSAVNKTVTLTMTRAAVSECNGFANGVTAILCGDPYGRASSHSLVLSTLVGNWWTPSVISGEAIATGNGSIDDFATDFELLTGTPTVYIDGVEQSSGVTVDTGKPFAYNNMGKYFVCLRRTGNNSAVPSPISVAAYAGEAIWYNPLYSQGISSFTAGSACKVEVSDDLSTWVTLHASGSSGSVSVSATYQNYKYWRLTGTQGSETADNTISALINATYSDAYNIHFDTAPASGAVITADYTTKTIAKDANHVFDLTITITLGEHVT